MRSLRRLFSRETEPYDFSIDPIFGQFKPWSGPVKAGFEANFVGQMTDVSFVEGWSLPERMLDRQAWPPYYAVSEETFEWEALLSAILDARDRFTMIEVGAGYGRWLVSAACAARRARPDLAFTLMGIEAEPTHFQWMRKHFRDNGIDPDAHRLIQGAVDAKDGEALFVFGHDPTVWYGQYVIDDPDHRGDDYQDAEPHQVPCYAVETLLAEIDRVDLVDFDIQGAEVRAIPAGIEAMTEKVRRVFVETHGPEIHQAVAAAFHGHGWRPIHNYPYASSAETRYGRVDFPREGLQVWLNPRLR